MTTAADLIAETKEHLRANQPEVKYLSGSHNASTTTFTFTTTLGSIQERSVLSVELEDVLVTAINASANTATVIRGWNGSTAATHATSTSVYVNPAYTDFRILRALNADLRSLSSPAVGLYRINTVDLTYNAAYRGYNLTSVSNMIGKPLQLLWEDSGGTRDWREIRKYRWSQDMPTDDFASGRAIFLDEGATAGQTLRVVYRSAFTQMSAVADDVVSTVGLTATMIDLPPLGAAIYLLASLPVVRTEVAAQGNTRRADEVKTTDTINAIASLKPRRRDRIAEEVARLTSLYPTRLPVAV